MDHGWTMDGLDGMDGWIGEWGGKWGSSQLPEFMERKVSLRKFLTLPTRCTYVV